MGAKGKQQSSGFERHVGFVEIKNIVAINPTREQRAALYGGSIEEDAKEIDYVTKDDSGTTRVFIDFYYESVQQVGIKRYRVTLADKERVNKVGDKYQYVNQLGVCTWADDEANLPDWFTSFTDKNGKVLAKKWVRKAYDGEELLMIFLRALFNFNQYNTDTELSYDIPKLLKGNVREIKEDIDTYFNDKVDRKIVGLLAVETSEDGEKQYEKLFGKMFLPKGFLRFINNGLKFPSEDQKKTWDKFTKEVEGQYGVKGYYIYEEAKVYREEDDFTRGGSTTEHAEDGAGYNSL